MSSDVFYEEEMNSIEWEDVDQYPAFSVCEQITEKPEQRECFTNTIKERLYLKLIDKNLSVNKDISDTVLIKFHISNSGKLKDKKIIMDSLLRAEIPLLEKWLVESIDSLPRLTPAYKRGIPVATEFKLPIVIQSEKSTN
ncbi:MAG: hypothetical protein HKN48_05845 [Flavobacteriaceae bacterium]|nr:hypothetical protein [Flavobacteriaceae bacterium]